MSNSDRLGETAASIGGGRGIFNEDALGHEVGLQKAVPKLKTLLETEYPNAEFLWKKRITKREIAAKVNPKVPYNPVSEKSFVSPDGGVLFVEYKGDKYPCKYLPILISEAKKQGTNNILQRIKYLYDYGYTDEEVAKDVGWKVERVTKKIKDGKFKQARGNAIERAQTNIENFKLYCENLNYFPYVIFACGCDFGSGSSILDRIDAMTRYEPRNVNYVADCEDLETGRKEQKVTAYVQEEYFTANEMFDKIYDVAKTSLKCIGM
jgi:type II restriction enzyme